MTRKCPHEPVTRFLQAVLVVVGASVLSADLTLAQEYEGGVTAGYDAGAWPSGQYAVRTDNCEWHKRNDSLSVTRNGRNLVLNVGGTQVRLTAESGKLATGAWPGGDSKLRLKRAGEKTAQLTATSDNWSCTNSYRLPQTKTAQRSDEQGVQSAPDGRTAETTDEDENQDQSPRKQQSPRSQQQLDVNRGEIARERVEDRLETQPGSGVTIPDAGTQHGRSGNLDEQIDNLANLVEDRSNQRDNQPRASQREQSTTSFSAPQSNTRTDFGQTKGRTQEIDAGDQPCSKLVRRAQKLIDRYQELQADLNNSSGNLADEVAARQDMQHVRQELLDVKLQIERRCDEGTFPDLTFPQPIERFAENVGSDRCRKLAKRIEKLNQRLREAAKGDNLARMRSLAQNLLEISTKKLRRCGFLSIIQPATLEAISKEQRDLFREAGELPGGEPDSDTPENNDGTTIGPVEPRPPQPVSEACKNPTQISRERLDEYILLIQRELMYAFEKAKGKVSKRKKAKARREARQMAECIAARVLHKKACKGWDGWYDENLKTKLCWPHPPQLPDQSDQTVGLTPRGLCGQWKTQITYALHLCGDGKFDCWEFSPHNYAKERDHTVVVIKPKDTSRQDGVLIDPWRKDGLPFVERVADDTAFDWGGTDYSK